LDECLHAVQAEFVEAVIKHRRDRFGGDALPVACGIDDVADRPRLLRM
jgi:hypothetical protein